MFLPNYAVTGSNNFPIEMHASHEKCMVTTTGGGGGGSLTARLSEVEGVLEKVQGRGQRVNKVFSHSGHSRYPRLHKNRFQFDVGSIYSLMD